MENDPNISASVPAGHRSGFVELQQLMPAPTAALLDLGKALRNSGLDLHVLELAQLRASQMNGCTYCLQHHLNQARKRSLSQAKLDLVAVWREATVFSIRERAALALAEAMTDLAREGVADTVYAEAASQFTTAELHALVTAVGAINAWNRIAITFRFAPPEPMA